jgi:drug/metabolite transporter (DMT)-like permease
LDFYLARPKIKKNNELWPMKRQNQAYLYALFAIICWSTIGSAFKITLHWLYFEHLLLISSGVAIIVLFVLLLTGKKLSHLKSLNFADIAYSAFLGFLNPFLYYTVLLKAYYLLPAQEAGTLNYIWPLVLVLLSIPLLRQRIKIISILAIFISFFGILLISTHGHIISFKFSNTYGVLLALGSAVFWALYWIFNTKDKMEPVTRLFLNFCFGFIYVLVLVLLIRPFSIPVWQGLLGSIYIGIFEMGITFVFWMMALKLSRTTAMVSNLIYLSPFISLVLIHFLVGETIFISTIIGLTFIVGGILIQQKVS